MIHAQPTVPDRAMGAIRSPREGSLNGAVCVVSAESSPRAVAATHEPPPLIGGSLEMQAVAQQACCYASSSATVLVMGESGTGKDVIARWIHACSPRADRPYVRVNCAALPESLVESELFGHERGAFTGAVENRIGKFEAAHEGTLLLDEIGEMPLHLQAKLLRVLEDGELQRVGGHRSIPIDVRVIAATNRPLERAVAAAEFRSDLYYRLHVLPLTVPPLRRRRDDIPPLVTYFIDKFGAESHVPVRAIRDDALQLLCDYSWPGNVRQLRNVVQHACVVCQTDVIGLGDLPSLNTPDVESEDFGLLRLEEIERRAVLSALRRHGGNQTAAARQLGITARTMHNKLKCYRGEMRDERG